MDCRNRTGSRHGHEQTHRVGRGWRLLLASLALIAAGSPAAKATYWNVFNAEGESGLSAVIVTYATLTDMLIDANRTGSFNPGGAANNVVGSGSDGTTYWNVFNIEGESGLSAVIVTYATLADMVIDTNRTGSFNPGGAANNVVGSGADILRSSPPPPGAVPEPAAIGLLASGVLGLALLRRRRRAA